MALLLQMAAPLIAWPPAAVNPLLFLEALARHFGISQVRVNEIINGKRGVSAQTAWLLAEAFGTSPQFWVSLQANYDLATDKPTRHVNRIKRAS